MSYTVELTSPPFDESETASLAALYRTYTDWAARLNTMCPGLPPAARLKLNLAIYERQAVPKSVRRTTPTRNGLVMDIVSKHTYEWELSPQDRTVLETFDDWANSFSYVDYDVFRKRAVAEGDSTE